MTEPILRATARLLPVNDDGEALLLLDQDPGRPGELRWGTIGGALDEGETHQQAAVRELFEETGLRIDVDDVVGPFHADRREFSYDGVAYLGDSSFFAVPMSREVEISFEHLEPAEQGNVFEARWMTPATLVDDGRLVAPDLPDIVSLAVATLAALEITASGEEHR